MDKQRHYGGQDVGIVESFKDVAIRDRYINMWGASYSGECTLDGVLRSQEAQAVYWSLTGLSANPAICLMFNQEGLIYPQAWYYKYYGLALRCVK